MNLGLVEQIAAAVLYEGYILYPYRPSSVKNRQRFNFGVLAPRSYSEAQGGTEAWSMRTECIVVCDDSAALDLKVRFLQPREREVRAAIEECRLRFADIDVGELASESNSCAVESLEVGGEVFQSWQETVERDVCLSNLDIGKLTREPRRLDFSFPARKEFEPLVESDGRNVGLIVREQQEIKGAVELQAEKVLLTSQTADGNQQFIKVTARVLNLTGFDDAAQRVRGDVLTRSMVSTHTILGVRGGEFVSMLDPPETLREHVAACVNQGTWPVLVGEEGERDCMLSSPIILYDYPRIAPESAGDLFDGTEIDEILTLRIMTLTDDEKREMRGADERARRILERTETLSAEHLMKLHGVVRSLRPLKEEER